MNSIIDDIMAGKLVDAKEALQDEIKARAVALVETAKEQIRLDESEKGDDNLSEATDHTDLVNAVFPVDFKDTTPEINVKKALYPWILKHESTKTIVPRTLADMVEGTNVSEDDLHMALKGAFMVTLKKFNEESPLRQHIAKSKLTPGGYALENDVLDMMDELVPFFKMVKKYLGIKLHEIAEESLYEEDDEELEESLTGMVKRGIRRVKNSAGIYRTIAKTASSSGTYNDVIAARKKTEALKRLKRMRDNQRK